MLPEATPAGMKMATLVAPDHSTLKRDGTFPFAANHFAALNGLFPLAASKAR
jgi:hypothetical protein